MAGVTDSFENGQTILKELAGIKTTDNAIRDVSQAEGQKIRQAEDKGQFLAGPSWRENKGQRVYIATDGTTAPMRGFWREAKTAVIYGEDGWGKRYLSSFDTSAEFMPKLRQLALEKGIASAGEQIFLGDGEPWIWKEARINFPDAVQILDWWHASEHVWECANILYGDGSGEAKAWADQRLDRMRYSGGRGLLSELQPKRWRLADKGPRKNNFTFW